jgi:hypothetical protein
MSDSGILHLSESHGRRIDGEQDVSGVWTRGIAGLALTAFAAGTAMGGTAQCSGGITVIGRVDGVGGNPFQAEVTGVIPTVTSQSPQPREPIPTLTGAGQPRESAD